MNSQNDIFKDSLFIGPTVSKEEYVKHYEEYVEKCYPEDSLKTLNQSLISICMNLLS